MPWARASALERHLVCPASSVLPRLEYGRWAPGYAGAVVPVELTEYVETAPWYTIWGSEMHRAIAAEGAPDPWDSWAAPVRDVVYPPELGVHERTWSYDCATGIVDRIDLRDEDARTAWKLSRGPDTVVGTSDWSGFTPDGLAWVCDLKTGWRRVSPLNPANVFYLMCLCLDSGVLKGRSSILWWPRKADMADSEPRRDWSGVIGTDTLLAFERELVDAWERSRGATADDVAPGPYCSRCNSAGVCPAWAPAARGTK